MRTARHSPFIDFAPGAKARLGAVALIAAGLVLLPAAPALAAVSCSYNSSTKVLDISFGDNDQVYVDRSGDNVRIQTVSGMSVVTVTCSGGQPTVHNTDTINIIGSTGTNYLHILLYFGSFAPGSTGEPGASDEIEITVDLLGGSDNLFVSGAPGGGPMNLRAGVAGMNLNALEATGVDADLTIASDINIQISGNSGQPNVISGAGGAGTGGPFPDELDIRGHDGANETLIGGAGNDGILAGSGKDLIAGGAGGDNLEGEEGRDTVTYRGTGGATVDLAAGTASDDGTGSTDFLSTVENVIGSANPDDLTGNDRKNKIVGGGARDLLFGMGDDDRLRGKDGRDQLQGETGNDDLHGGPGRRDLCIGGPGDDRLRSCEL